MVTRFLLGLILVFISSPLAQPLYSQEQSAATHVANDELIAVYEGSLPIIISAPHGGRKSIPGLIARTGAGLETGGKGFFAGRDSGTEELAHDVIDAIEREMGGEPFAVINRVHRKFLDVNRPMDIGTESEQAQPIYREYHSSLAQLCRQVQNRFRGGLLLDLHGQKSDPETVFRGTQNGKTVALLQQRFGASAHVGGESLFGLLKSHGLKVFPEPGNGKEQSGFTGGYIVQSYGSHTAFGIDAVQLEFGSSFRSKENRKKTAKQVATAVKLYCELYLKSAISSDQ
jgi:N-formylglutamate amidohydrolase